MTTRTGEGGLLFLSNGHGEDLIAARLATEVSAVLPGARLSALPLVGLGEAYQRAGIPLLLPGRTMPSGGFIRNGPRNLLMDIRAGLLSLTACQIRTLRAAREQTRLAVCVGDVLLIILAGNWLRRPIVFLPTAKSDYVSPHWRIEIGLMRRYCRRVFARDALTAASLSRAGVPASFLGNVMMDCLDFDGDDLRAKEGGRVVGILPGSREEGYLNLEDIGRVALAFQDFVPDEVAQVTYLVALSGRLSFAAAAERLAASGWKPTEAPGAEKTRGILGYLEQAGVRLIFTKDRFADVLRASDAVIGLAGTANEQAAGLGVPVLTFVGRGPQFTAKFLRTQKRLLGEALWVADRDPAAAARSLRRLLLDADLRARMAAAGRERMGGPGGAGRIAAAISALLAAP